MKKKKCLWLTCIFLSFVGLCLFATSASAAVVTWVGTDSLGVWYTPTNWSGGYVPGAGDDVVLPDIGKSYSVIIVLNPSNPISFTVNSLTIEGNTYTSTLQVYNSGDLTIINALGIHSKGAIQIWSDGIVRALGPVTVDSGGSLSVGHSAYPVQGTLQIDDTMTNNSSSLRVYGNLVLNGTYQGSAGITLYDGSTFTGTGGIINITSPGALSMSGNISLGGSLTYQGDNSPQISPVC